MLCQGFPMRLSPSGCTRAKSAALRESAMSTEDFSAGIAASIS